MPCINHYVANSKSIRGHYRVFLRTFVDSANHTPDGASVVSTHHAEGDVYGFIGSDNSGAWRHLMLIRGLNALYL